ncbi:MAG TPA: hypothetical protein VNK24_10530 [Elusimicrobiota bacterium]|nr:hypothetical protein [Elusimicrobiota bacterium]
MTIKFSKNSDPFKKYWWVLLLIFSAVGVWISYPSYQSGQGMDASAFGRNLMTVRQSLNSLNNPAGAGGAGAPGAPVGGLAMNGQGQGAYTKEGGAAMDGLFPHPAAAKAAAAKPRTFADDLSAIAGMSGRGGAGGLSGAAASAAIPVESPSLGSGFSNGSGTGGDGGSSASYSPPPILGSASGSFSEGQTKTGLQNASDLSGANAPAGGGALGALKSAAQSAVQSANEASNAAAASGLSNNFDGARASGQIGAMAGGGQSDSGVGIGGGGVPMSLKQNPKDLMIKKITPPAPMPVAPNSGNAMMQMMMMMLPMLMMGMMSA